MRHCKLAQLLVEELEQRNLLSYLVADGRCGQRNCPQRGGDNRRADR